MRWNMGMLHRGFVVLGIAALVIGWTVYTADQVVKEVGRTVAFGLKPFEIDVNRALKGDRLVRADGEPMEEYLFHKLAETR